ncbi:hypothetical protein [Algoriphagus boritolerans]|uniref:hypothetical protein n=1 Tax=Algoriphagus boritolerans TaxID=308111 RepID=UPI000A5A43D9
MKQILFLFLFIGTFPFLAKAQTVPSPQSHFGFDIGDEYMLANFSQAEAYFKKSG